MELEVLTNQLRSLDCRKCPCRVECRDADGNVCLLFGEAADRLLAQQARIAQLEEELKEERYRHDRVQDFEVAEAQELAKLREERRWIPVGERLPEPFVSVLAVIPSEAPLPVVHESYIADHEKWVCILTGERYHDGEVTHWMPLPEPPEEDV